MPALTGARRRVAAVVVAVLLCALAVLSWQARAQAAPKLESSTPASGESIPAGGPVEIVLRFSEPLRTDGASLVLFDEDGNAKMKADVEIDGKTLHGLLPEVPPGDYEATYRATTTSGDAVNGRLPFSISGAAISILGVDFPSWGPTALIVLFVGLAACVVIAIMATAARR